MDGALAALDRAREECRSVSVWALSPAALPECLDLLEALARQVAAKRLEVIREIDVQGVAVEQGAPTTAAWLQDRCRLSRGAANRQVKLAAKLDTELRATGDALYGGEVNLEQVEEIVKAVGLLPVEHRAAGEKYLLDEAAMFGPRELASLGEHLFEVVAPKEAEARAREALERAEERAFAGRELRLSKVAGEDRVRLTGWLDRESAAQLRAAIDPLCAPRSSAGEADVRTPGQRRADALIEVCRIAMACGGLPDNGGDRPQVTVTVDFDALREQLGAATLDDGSLLSAAAARRLACDAALLPAVLDGAGQVLDVARERRLFKGALRRALIVRDRGCAFPGCDRPPRWTDGHHIVHWADGGTTSLDNAVLLCGHHHRLVHHSPWRVRINPADGLPEFVPPEYVDPEQKPQRNRYHRRQ